MPFSPGKLAYSKKKAPPRKIKVFRRGVPLNFIPKKLLFRYGKLRAFARSEFVFIDGRVVAFCARFGG